MEGVISQWANILSLLIKNKQEVLCEISLTRGNLHVDLFSPEVK